MNSLLILAALSFFVGLPTISQRDIRWWKELILALSLGIFFALMGTYWLSLFHLDGNVIQSDFLEYCTGVSAPHHQSTGVSSKRSTLPLWIPRYFYHQFELGIFDALAMGSIVSMGCIGFLFYYWGRFLGGSWTGICCVLAACTLGPLTLIGHHLTSYPEMTLCFVLCATTTTIAICRPTMWGQLIGGCGIGIALLADARGLFWALPMFLGILARNCMWFIQKKDPQRGFLLLLMSMLPVVYSWFWGSYFFVPQAIGFEEQVDIRPMLYRFLGESSGYQPAYSYNSRWVWGFGSPLQIFDTIAFLLEQGSIDVPDQLSHRSEVAIGRKLVRTYLDISICTFLISCFYLFKNNKTRCWAFFCSCIPFVIALYGNQSLLENHSRFYFQTLPATAICMGVLASISATFMVRRHIFWYVPQFCIFMAIVFGFVTTPLSPNSSWQIRWTNSDASMSQWIQAYQNGEMDRDANLRHCRRAFQLIEFENLPFYPQLYQHRSIDEK